eukprot:10381595-Alexandrium_andersonii.AAC.1
MVSQHRVVACFLGARGNEGVAGATVPSNPADPIHAEQDNPQHVISTWSLPADLPYMQLRGSLL